MSQPGSARYRAADCRSRGSGLSSLPTSPPQEYAFSLPPRAAYSHSASERAAGTPWPVIRENHATYRWASFQLTLTTGCAPRTTPLLDTRARTAANLDAANSTIEQVLGFAAVALGTGNVVGGFVVTDRMLEMFKPRKRRRSERKAE